MSSPEGRKSMTESRAVLLQYSAIAHHVQHCCCTAPYGTAPHRTFSRPLSSLKAAKGEALTAPKDSNQGPTGPAQCPGWARPRTLRGEGKARQASGGGRRRARDTDTGQGWGGRSSGTGGGGGWWCRGSRPGRGRGQETQVMYAHCHNSHLHPVAVACCRGKRACMHAKESTGGWPSS